MPCARAIAAFAPVARSAQPSSVAKKPVQESNQRRHQNQQPENRVLHTELAHVQSADKERIFANVDTPDSPESP